MGGFRVGLVVVVGLLAAVIVHPRAVAQPAESGSDVELESEQAGSANGSATTPAPEPVVKDPKIAKKWLQAATQLVQKGDAFTRAKRPDDAKGPYENAVTAYQKAIEASDDINLDLDLGNVLDKLGKFDEAMKSYRRVVSAKAGVKPDVLKKATAKLDDESTKIGMVTLSVKPEGATVSLGGTAIGLTPLPEPLILMPGTYTLSFEAPGFQPKDSEIKVEAGSESERAIELEPIQIIVQPVKPEFEEPRPVVVSTGPSKLPLYVGGGIAVGLTGVAIVTGILATSQHGTYTDRMSTGIEREDAKSNGQTLALVTDICLVTAVAAAGFTTYWYFSKYKAPKPKAERDARAPVMTKVDVMPWVQPNTGGVVLGGWF